MVMCNDLRRSSTVAAFRRGGSCSRCPQPDVVPALHPQRPRGGNEPFGIKPDVFTIESEAVGAMLATHAAIALIADDERLQFQSALASRDIIGQAKGKIMERFNVDAVRAFELLVWICAEEQSSIPVDQDPYAASFPVLSSGRSTSLPFWNIAPARTSATRCGALTARQRDCAASISL